MLLLSRYRRNDPLVEEALRATGDRDWPCIEAVEQAEVQLPDYDTRSKAAARDPYAVVSAFKVHVRLVLAKLLGLRMCPRCPHCNAAGSRQPCQDMFGSSMEPMGGIIGAAEALAGAVEHQRLGTPHLHFLVFLASIYQHRTLAEIADLMERELLRPEAVMEFHTKICREDHCVESHRTSGATTGGATYERHGSGSSTL